MPRKGAPIKDFRDLSKARIRRRRRRILAGLAEVSGLFILMGLFPPLHGMLVPGVVLLGLLLAYTVLLARVKAVESERARAAGRQAGARRRGRRRRPSPRSQLRFRAAAAVAARRSTSARSSKTTAT